MWHMWLGLDFYWAAIWLALYCLLVGIFSFMSFACALPLKGRLRKAGLRPGLSVFLCIPSASGLSVPGLWTLAGRRGLGWADPWVGKPHFRDTNSLGGRGAAGGPRESPDCSGDIRTTQGPPRTGSSPGRPTSPSVAAIIQTTSPRCQNQGGR